MSGRQRGGAQHTFGAWHPRDSASQGRTGPFQTPPPARPTLLQALKAFRASASAGWGGPRPGPLPRLKPGLGAALGLQAPGRGSLGICRAQVSTLQEASPDQRGRLGVVLVCSLFRVESRADGGMLYPGLPSLRGSKAPSAPPRNRGESLGSLHITESNQKLGQINSVQRRNKITEVDEYLESLSPNMKFPIPQDSPWAGSLLLNVSVPLTSTKGPANPLPFHL